MIDVGMLCIINHKVYILLVYAPHNNDDELDIVACKLSHYLIIYSTKVFYVGIKLAIGNWRFEISVQVMKS